MRTAHQHVNHSAQLHGSSDLQCTAHIRLICSPLASASTIAHRPAYRSDQRTNQLRRGKRSTRPRSSPLKIGIEKVPCCLDQLVYRELLSRHLETSNCLDSSLPRKVTYYLFSTACLQLLYPMLLSSTCLRSFTFSIFLLTSSRTLPPAALRGAQPPCPDKPTLDGSLVGCMLLLRCGLPR